MSNSLSLHYTLCLEGAKWLHKAKRNWHSCETKDCHKPEFCRCCHRFKYVAVELCTYGTENTDVWGFSGCYTAVIEVKTSRADFLADRKKWWRSQEAEERGMQAGTYRWYLCPSDMIKPDELPSGWGLLYWDGKKINQIVGALPNENTWQADMRIFYSIVRREALPEKIYNYRVTEKIESL